MKSNRNIQKLLFQAAEPQQGLFTAKQAEDVGYIRTNHAYHVKSGDWIREERGIYRLALFPQSREQQRATYALWSRSRDGEIQGVYSHETALAFYDLSDVNPSKLHMTVPRSFRRNAETPGVLKLYRADLGKDEITRGPGYLVTTPIRTLRDVIESGKLSLELVEQAISGAIARGLVTRSELRAMIEKLKKEAPAAVTQEVNAILRKATA